jgi:hypothetical protein
MPRGQNLPFWPAYSPAELRALAHRVRRLAYNAASDEIAGRLWKIADEMEAEADALDRQSPHPYPGRNTQ